MQLPEEDWLIFERGFYNVLIATNSPIIDTINYDQAALILQTHTQKTWNNVQAYLKGSTNLSCYLQSWGMRVALIVLAQERGDRIPDVDIEPGWNDYLFKLKESL